MKTNRYRIGKKTERYLLCGAVITSLILAIIAQHIADADRLESARLKLNTALRTEIGNGAGDINFRETAERFGDSINSIQIFFKYSNGQSNESGSSPLFPLCVHSNLQGVEVSLCESRSPVGGIIGIGLFILLLISVLSLRLSDRLEKDVLSEVNTFLEKETVDIPKLESLSGLFATLKNFTLLKHNQKTLEIRLATESAIKKATHQIAHDLSAPIAGLKFIISDENISKDERSHLLWEVSVRLSKLREELSHAVQNQHINEEDELLSSSEFSELISRNCRTTLSTLSSASKYSEEIKITGSKQSLVRFNRQKVIRIFSNLIKNSVEAAKQNAAEIHLKVVSYDGFLEFCLRDTGTGIHPDEIQKIGNRGYSLKIAGSGMGVSDAKEYLEHIGGALSVRSIFGEYTEVICVFATHKPSYT